MVWGLVIQPNCDCVDNWKSSTLVHLWKKLGIHKPLCIENFLEGPWMVGTLVQPLAII